MTKLYKYNATLYFAVEANDRAEAQREILKLMHDTAKELPTGVSMEERPVSPRDMRGVYLV